jgi:hypothetical protein
LVENGSEIDRVGTHGHKYYFLEKK